MMKVLFILALFATVATAQTITLPQGADLFRLRPGSDTIEAAIRTGSAREFDSSTATRRTIIVKRKPVDAWLVKHLGEDYYIGVEWVRRQYTKEAAPRSGDKPDVQSGSSYSSQCTGTTRSGNRCKRMTNNASGKCWQHE
ncbi:MAG: hypothetical protein JNL32_03625 [Candidatus Kapabacteria bacterium]|nr:hypothetical protein [Candidatus Kapabacteria bacterium]